MERLLSCSSPFAGRAREGRRMAAQQNFNHQEEVCHEVWLTQLTAATRILKGREGCTSEMGGIGAYHTHLHKGCSVQNGAHPATILIPATSQPSAQAFLPFPPHGALARPLSEACFTHRYPYLRENVTRCTCECLWLLHFHMYRGIVGH
jgi:hypothetical protein